ncbi:hypothetical protein FQN60_006533 [Etheostoma spectabile]|uniref:Uncharacterized protein n=1 Tax=Etheostoma spectabile TaxID=54343 RepID=A0A5J5CH71_9PERO|nr:hypothetical protein FQN60_006533 [Etheostoma spectabile]
MYLIFVQFQTIWIRTDSDQGFHVRGCEQTEARERTVGLGVSGCRGARAVDPSNNMQRECYTRIYIDKHYCGCFVPSLFGVSAGTNHITEQSALKW